MLTSRSFRKSPMCLPQSLGQPWLQLKKKVGLIQSCLLRSKSPSLTKSPVEHHPCSPCMPLRNSTRTAGVLSSRACAALYVIEMDLECGILGMGQVQAGGAGVQLARRPQPVRFQQIRLHSCLHWEKPRTSVKRPYFMTFRFYISIYI